MLRFTQHDDFKGTSFTYFGKVTLGSPARSPDSMPGWSKISAAPRDHRPALASPRAATRAVLRLSTQLGCLAGGSQRAVAIATTRRSSGFDPSGPPWVTQESVRRILRVALARRAPRGAPLMIGTAGDLFRKRKL
jgi:hypothetical protein